MTGQAPQIRVEPPGPLSRNEIERLGKLLYPGHSFDSLPLVVDGMEAGVIIDLDGNRYLDLAAAQGTNPFGLPPTSVVDAATTTLSDFGNEDVHHLTNETVTTLARRLIDLSPASLTRVDMALSGTEAVEIALRLMRRAARRPLVLGFYRQHHGKTAAAMGLGAAGGSGGMRHLTPGFVHVPHPYRSPFEPAPESCGDMTVDYIRSHLLFHAVDPGDVAGVVVQPLTAEAVSPPDSFWPALTELCEEHGWLLCADEVFSGLGRGGYMLSVERWGVQPDLLCLGESLSAGTLPIGAVLGSEDVMASFADTETGSTWSWLPAACSAAAAGLAIMEEPGFLAHIKEMEALARQSLRALSDLAWVDDVRVEGALVGIDLSTPEIARRTAAETRRRGVIGIPGESTFGLMPPLTIPVDDYERGLHLVVAAVESAGASV